LTIKLYFTKNLELQIWNYILKIMKYKILFHVIWIINDVVKHKP